MTTLLTPFVCCLLGQLVIADPVPETLVKAFMNRMAFKTARFTLRIEENRKLLQPYVRRFRFELARGARYIVALGDDHGMTEYGDSENVPLGVAHRAEPRLFFINAANDECWSYSWGRVDHYPPGLTDIFHEWCPDPRSFGLLSGYFPPQSPEKYLELFREGRFVVEESKPGIVHIRHSSNGKEGHRETEWWIDVARGPEVFQMRGSYVNAEGDARVFCDITSEVEQVDGHWWPRRLDYHHSYQGKDRTGVVMFENIEFDRPEHAQTLDADILEIPLGTRVYRPHKRGTPFEHIRYAGHGKVIAEDHWLRTSSDDEIKKVYEAEWRHNFRLDVGFAPDWWEDKDDAYGLKDAPTRPELWELYLRRWALKRRTNAMWIAKDPLTNYQCRAAQAILDDCRKKVLSANPADVEALFNDFKKRLGELLTDAQRDPTNAGWHKQRLKRIHKPPIMPKWRPPPKPFAPWNKWRGGPAIF